MHLFAASVVPWGGQAFDQHSDCSGISTPAADRLAEALADDEGIGALWAMAWGAVA